MFFLARFIIPVIIVVLLFWGISLIVRGVRGSIEASEPFCRKCRYPLREVLVAGSPNCPECGAELSVRRAVAFGRSRRRPGLVVAGVGVVVLPFLAWITVTLLVGSVGGPTPAGTGPASLAAMTPGQLAAVAARGAEGPWLWQEIDARRAAGALTREELVAVLDAVTGSLAEGTATRTAVMAWGLPSLRAHVFDQDLPEATRTALAEALAPILVLRGTQRMKARATRQVRVDLSDQSRPDMDDTLVAIHDIRIVGDGLDRPLEPARPSRRVEDPPLRFAGSRAAFSNTSALPRDLPAGRYEIRADVELAAFFEKPPLLQDGRRPRHPDRWSESLVRRRATIKAPLTVLTEDEAVVPFLAPIASKAAAERFKSAIRHLGLKVSRDRVGRAHVTLLRPAERGTRPPEAYCFEIVAIIGEREVVLGHEAGRGGGQSRSGGSATIDELPNDVTTAVIEYRPAPDEADRLLQLNDDGTLPAIIGETIVFEDVPIDREDGGE